MQYLQDADIMDRPFFYALSSVLYCSGAVSASRTEFISTLSYSPCLNVSVYLAVCDAAPTVAGNLYVNSTESRFE